MRSGITRRGFLQLLAAVAAAPLVSEGEAIRFAGVPVVGVDWGAGPSYALLCRYFYEGPPSFRFVQAVHFVDDGLRPIEFRHWVDR
jgi:hypothetical protein